MSTLGHIPVCVEPIGSVLDAQGMVGGGMAAILTELAVLLERLVQHGEPGAIDVRSLPLSPTERMRLIETLGAGEVDIRIQANGESHIRETSIPGVWWSEHRDSDGVLLVTLIEVARVPEMLAAADADLVRGAERLRAVLAPLCAAHGGTTHGTT